MLLESDGNFFILTWFFIAPPQQALSHLSKLPQDVSSHGHSWGQFIALVNSLGCFPSSFISTLPSSTKAHLSFSWRGYFYNI